MGDSTQLEAAQIAALLVARIAGGDRQAESELISRYSRAVTFVLSRRCGDAERVRDVHQDTFITVIECLRRAGVSRPEALSAFIQSTAINLLTAERRRDVRRRTDIDDEVVLRQCDHGPGPPEQLERANEAKLVREVIAELPVARDREILHRFYMEELDKSDICRDLGISHLHFHRVLFRARRRFLEGLSRLRAARTPAAVSAAEVRS